MRANGFKTFIVSGGGIVAHHTDEECEYALYRRSKVSRLDQALDAAAVDGNMKRE
jgi:hypothetical protein